MAIAHAALQHLQLVAIGPEQGTIAISADQATADQIEEYLPGPRGEATEHGVVALFVEQVFKAAAVLFPLGLGLEQRIGAERTGLPQQLAPLLGDRGSSMRKAVSR